MRVGPVRNAVAYLALVLGLLVAARLDAGQVDLDHVLAVAHPMKASAP